MEGCARNDDDDELLALALALARCRRRVRRRLRGDEDEERSHATGEASFFLVGRAGRGGVPVDGVACESQGTRGLKGGTRVCVLLCDEQEAGEHARVGYSAAGFSASQVSTEPSSGIAIHGLIDEPQGRPQGFWQVSFALRLQALSNHRESQRPAAKTNRPHRRPHATLVARFSWPTRRDQLRDPTTGRRFISINRRAAASDQEEAAMAFHSIDVLCAIDRSIEVNGGPLIGQARRGEGRQAIRP